jgi:hypothetical protein
MGALRRSLSRPGRCTLTTEEWQEIRKTTDERTVEPSDEVAAARLRIFSESLILAQDKRWRRA